MHPPQPPLPPPYVGAPMATAHGRTPYSGAAPGVPAPTSSRPRHGPTTTLLRDAPGRPATPSTRARVAGTVGAIVATTFSSTLVVAFASRDPLMPTGGTVSGWWALGWLLVIAVDVVAVSLRARLPVAMCVLASATALLLPLDSLAALVVLPWVIARRPRRVAVWCTVLVTVATGVSLARDALRPATNAVFTVVLDGAGTTRLLPIGYVVLTLVFVGVAVAAGLVRRSAEVARHAVDRQQHSDRVVAELRTEMSRQEERELIAREVHDTVAHQLSLVSLQASVLEVTGPDGAAAAQAGRDMRSAAHHALDEMRRLIGTLRDAGSAPWSAGAPPTLADLPELIGTARSAGARVRAMVFVSDAADAPVGLTRAVYRIVQESLTNALKHAPGEEVEIDVSAAPGTGVNVLVTNPMAAAPGAGPAAPGAGAGLAGMRERAALAGGQVEAGELDGRFVVRASLPWPAPGRASVGSSSVRA